MKANELRIGNFVYGYKTVWIIDSTDFRITEIIETYKPIPLTEEWLVKFGFKDLENHPIYCSVDSNGNISVAVSYSDEANPYLVHIKYVHQLQNLFFALTGNELELKEL